MQRPYTAQRPGEVIADYPAFSIHKPAGKTALFGDVRLPVFAAGETVGLPFKSARYGVLYHWFKFGSVASYSLQYHECPIKSYELAQLRGHKLHWLTTLPTSLTSDRRAKEERIAMKFGDRVIFEGRVFEIQVAPNQNAELREIIAL